MVQYNDKTKFMITSSHSNADNLQKAKSNSVTILKLRHESPKPPEFLIVGTQPTTIDELDSTTFLTPVSIQPLRRDPL